MGDYFRKILQSSLVTLITLLLAGNVPLVIAAVMSSSNYKIQADSVNFGGKQGNSASYRLEDTLGEVATGDSESTNYKLKAGYQQMVTTLIAMSAASDVTMSPSLGGLTGGTSNGSAATTVTTDSPAGYELYIKASSTPAMRGNTQGDDIDNYVSGAVGVPDYNFTTTAADAVFAFTPEGSDVANEYRDDGSETCSSGSNETADKCWAPVTTTNELISRRTSANNPSGTVTTVKFRIYLGSSSFTVEDTYTATTTLTAVTL